MCQKFVDNNRSDIIEVVQLFSYVWRSQMKILFKKYYQILLSVLSYIITIIIITYTGWLFNIALLSIFWNVLLREQQRNIYYKQKGLAKIRLVNINCYTLQKYNTCLGSGNTSLAVTQPLLLWILANKQNRDANGRKISHEKQKSLTITSVLITV